MVKLFAGCLDAGYMSDITLRTTWNCLKFFLFFFFLEMQQQNSWKNEIIQIYYYNSNERNIAE